MVPVGLSSRGKKRQSSNNNGEQSTSVGGKVGQAVWRQMELPQVAMFQALPSKYYQVYRSSEVVHVSRRFLRMTRPGTTYSSSMEVFRPERTLM